MNTSYVMGIILTDLQVLFHNNPKGWSYYNCHSWGKVKVKVAQSCLTLCDPMNYRVHGILQTVILEWIAVLFSRGSSQPRDPTHVFCIAGRFFTS